MKELRIGLVLYGGVSLAVYINGVTTEIWHALRASQSRHGRQLDGRKALSGSAAVYRDFLDELAREAGAEELRIVVDAIAGTSAGGLNGAALAKAIVEGGDASVLHEVWIERADIAALKAQPSRAPAYVRAPVSLITRTVPAGRRLRTRIEQEWGLDLDWARDAVWQLVNAESGDQSPLNGRYFTQMIAAAFKQMDEADRKGPALLPDRGTFDLFLTRTDLYGWPRHLPLSRDFHAVPVFERHHAHMMSFHRRPNAGSDQLNPLVDFDLTFAARTTAGFPGAFAPVAFESVAVDYRKARQGEDLLQLDEFACRHLREHDLEGFPVGCTWMVDGGVLDNKPFTDVAAAIEAKPADYEVHRVVAYIEPDPVSDRRGVPEDWPPNECPRPLEALQRLYGVVRNEPIYEDLRRLDARNHKVETLRSARNAAWEEALRVAKQTGVRVGLTWPPSQSQLAQWREEVNKAAAQSQLSGYPGYVGLKARRASAVAAEAICRALNHPYQSRHGYFIRRLVRAWLSGKRLFDEPKPMDGNGYAVSDAQRQFLEAFDLPFRLRRVRMLVQAINACYGKAHAGPTNPSADELTRQALDEGKRVLADTAFGFEAAYRDETQIKKHLSLAFGGLSSQNINDSIRNMEHNSEKVVSEYDAQLTALYDSWRSELAAKAAELNKGIDAAFAALPAAAQEKVAEALIGFPLLDVLLYPLMEMADITDIIEVKVMRFSPDDRSTFAGVASPLKGRELGAFAGFLGRDARDHDLLLGRLDGAERLIELIFKAAVAADADRQALEPLRAEFTRRVMQAVLDEEANREGTSIAGLATRFKRHLASQPVPQDPAVA